MALQLFPDISKTTSVSDGTKYAYIHVPAADTSKPTFLLLHGFPSATFDWRHIMPMLTERKYGIIAPDLLGYGDSDKPTDVAAYSFERMAGHVVEIIKAEGLTQVIGVGHDW
jgi:soluble epoxide hydrolase / lipid-phosphate phosphatase